MSEPEKLSGFGYKYVKDKDKIRMGKKGSVGVGLRS